MAKQTAKRVKHIPQRTCVGCRLVLPKRSLTRVVRTAEGVRVDPTGKLAGRGAYLHNAQSCWQRALKGALASALRTDLTEQDRANLQTYWQQLPEEPQEELEQPSHG